MGKDIQNKRGTINHPEISKIGDRPDLGRIEFLVENKQVGIESQGGNDNLGEFSTPQNKAGIDFIAALQYLVEYQDIVGAGQFSELLQRGFSLQPWFSGNIDEYRPIPLLVEMGGSTLSAELFFQSPDQLVEPLWLPGRVHRIEETPHLTVFADRQQMR